MDDNSKNNEEKKDINNDEESNDKYHLEDYEYKFNRDVVPDYNLYELEDSYDKKRNKSFLYRYTGIDLLYEKILIFVMSLISICGIISIVLGFRGVSISDGLIFGRINSVINVLTFCMILIIILTILKLFYEKIPLINFFKGQNILISLGTLSFIIGNIIINNIAKAIRVVGSITGNEGIEALSEIDSSVIKVAKSSAAHINFRIILCGIFYIIGIVLFFMTIVLLAKYFTDDARINEISDSISSKINGAVDDIDKEEVGKKVKDTTINAKNKFENYKRQILTGIIGIVVIFGGLWIYKTVKYYRTPDAVVSTEDMDIRILYSGFDRKATAKAEVVGAPKVSEVKNPEKTDEITSKISEYEIKIDKDKDLRNGDEITVTVIFPKLKGYNIKMDNSQFFKKFTVSDLTELVIDATDITENHLERMEGKIKESISSSIFSEYKDLKVEKLKSLEKPVPEEDVESGNIYARDKFSMFNLYKVTYERKKLSSDKEEYEKTEKVMGFVISKFKKSGESLIFDVHKTIDRKFSDFEPEDIVNKMKIEGYREVY